ncbi:FHA domain-containing serine/threonine-protein kinase [Candidatus Oscillochloris fontis]|uniref:FHA domain-containing serine/threonine-protein kinase n=1 Tax=Candidatus Oscillochloris fontis TaxID=2496868 RepID=UPI0013756C3F|nr:FHA domain-containing serine/threonine-protein kinase [Candidatus Oscillochloris fontis]
MQPGDHLLHYHIRQLLGEGGFGQVFLAHDQRLLIDVALKVMRPELAADSAVLHRFLIGARTAARLRHPNIQLVYTMARDEATQTNILVMEYLSGGDLRARLARGKLLPTEAIHTFTTICQTMDVAHQQGVIHRDLKPANIMFHADGRLVITDFDLARIRSEIRHTRSGTVLGTTAYASPEQLRGEDVTPASDVYSLALILFELLTGQRLFRGTPSEIVQSHLYTPVPHLADIAPYLPAQLDAVLQMALDKQPTRRFQRAADLVAAVTAIYDQSALTEAPTPRQPFVTQQLEANQPALLRVLAGPQVGQVFPLHASTSIGSYKAPNDIVLQDSFASRTHARIQYKAAQYQITDLGSANGTLLNQQRLTAHQPVNLAPGDEIRIGYTLLRFEGI